MARSSLRAHFRTWIVGGCAVLAFACLAVSFLDGWTARARAQDARLAARAGGQARLEFAEEQGRVVRAAIVGDRVVASERALERLPARSEVLSAKVLAFIAGTLLMGALAGLAAHLALRRLRGAFAAFDCHGRLDAAPLEVAPALQGLATLREQERAWVNEQRAFLAEAAHQLRTPMAVLRAELQEALQSDSGPAANLAHMLHTVDRATRVANQLLSVSRVEQLKRSGELGRIDVGQCVRDAIVELSPLIAEKRLEFSLDGPGFEAGGDAVMLGELLRNLMRNAIHHSAPGARAGVVTRFAPHREVIVWDEGPGIADAVRPRLFTPFGAQRGGVGLGLSICQQIAAAMGAEVSLHNRLEHDRCAGVDAVVRWRPAGP